MTTDASPIASRNASRLAALVLAAGAGSRFSDLPAGKLLARLDSQPVLQHVLGAIRSFGPAATVVVLGHGADEIEAAIAWQAEQRVRNLDPDQGIASSLQVGIRALSVLSLDLEGAFIVLGDQPRLVPATLHALEAAARAAPSGRAIVVPEYADDPGPGNPVLLRREGWGLVDAVQGDRGLAPLIHAHPELVLRVALPGTMPDVDRPEDLDRLIGSR
jgi:CTP:molybdopterin cytidylyltransferase MocA